MGMSIKPNSVFVDKIENAGVMHGYGLYPLKNFMTNDPQIMYRPAVIQGANPEVEITASDAREILRASVGLTDCRDWL